MMSWGIFFGLDLRVECVCSADHSVHMTLLIPKATSVLFLRHVLKDIYPVLFCFFFFLLKQSLAFQVMRLLDPPLCIAYVLLAVMLPRASVVDHHVTGDGKPKSVSSAPLVRGGLSREPGSSHSFHWGGCPHVLHLLQR